MQKMASPTETMIVRYPTSLLRVAKITVDEVAHWSLPNEDLFRRIQIQHRGKMFPVMRSSPVADDVVVAVAGSDGLAVVDDAVDLAAAENHVDLN